MTPEKAFFELSAGLSSQLPPSDLPELVFCGRSNVGKSSLINKILGRKSLARVSSQPGKTATINFYHLGDSRLVDLPGYGYAKVSRSEKERWGELIEGYFAQDRKIALVVMLIDSRHKPSADDMGMLSFFEETQLPVIIALTKIDKLNKSERAARLAAFPKELGCDDDAPLIPFSSLNGEGAAEILEILKSVVEDQQDN